MGLHKFIEIVRGVPLITLLFVSNILLVFLPPDATLDSVIRVIIMVTAFASAYMAEVIKEASSDTIRTI